MENFSPALPLGTGWPFSVPSSPIQQFTSTQLASMSSSDAAAIGLVAYCSDCLSTRPMGPYETGDVCFWAGTAWMTHTDRIVPTTDFLQFALSIARSGKTNLLTPYYTVSGDGIQSVTTQLAYVSGSGAITYSTNVNSAQYISTALSTGTTSTGSAKTVSISSVSVGASSSPYRSVALVCSMCTSSSALSNAGVDNWHWRVSLETPVFASTSAVVADMFSLIMDDQNSLGFGSTGTTVYALGRANATNFSFVNTTINPTTTPAFYIITFEPNGTGNQGRARVATANNLGQTITTHVDSTFTLNGTALLPTVVETKTLGTGARVLNRRFIRVVTQNNQTTTPATFVQ